jgi:hypothetical protein
MIELSARPFLELSEVEPRAMTELSEKNYLIDIVTKFVTAHG